MKSILSFLFLSYCVISSQAQTHCDGLRYRNRVFVELDSAKSIQFGSNTQQAGNTKNLFMDVYWPKNDTFQQRPVILLAHGGSFIVGSRDEIKGLCYEFASRGFTAITIDYRLFNNFAQSIDSIVIYDVVTEAVSDMRSAVRKVREDASINNPYGVDTNLIFIGGVSAGAITADHYAYLDSTDNLNPVLDSIIQSNGGFEGNSSSNFQFSSDVKGVLNYSGALRHDYWIQAGDVPLFSVHEDQDPVVPYGKQVTTSLGTPIEVSGSGAMHPVAEQVGVMNRLITIENSNGHVQYFLDGPNTEIYDIIIDSTTAFLERIMCTEPTGLSNIQPSEISVYPNPSSSSFHIDGGDHSFSWSLWNILGKEVKKAKHSKDVDVSDIPPGVYILKIDSDIKTFTKKVLVE